MDATDTESADEHYAEVKTPGGGYRITPPGEIRTRVGMAPDESWSWFWQPSTQRFYLRRGSARLDGIPDDVIPVGTSTARRNGRYVDMSIPVEARERAEMSQGQRWKFEVRDTNTIVMVLAG